MRFPGLLLAKLSDGTVRRFLFVAAVAFWLGGFMFYGGVVIDAGAKVLGSHRKQGFVTERVTVMDRLLDPAAKAVLDPGRFDDLHVVYLTSSTVQWAAGMIHVWCAVAGKEM
jgi:hypothetical protein